MPRPTRIRITSLLLLAALSACGGQILETGRDYHLDDAEGRISIRFEGERGLSGTVMILRNDGRLPRQLRAELWSVSFEHWGNLRREERLYVTRTAAPVPRDRDGRPTLPFKYEKGQLVLGPTVVLTELHPGREESFRLGEGGLGTGDLQLHLQWLDEDLVRHSIAGGTVAGKGPARAPENIEAIGKFAADYFAAYQNQDLQLRRTLEHPASLECIDKVSKQWFQEDLLFSVPRGGAEHGWWKVEVDQALDDPAAARLPVSPDAAIIVSWLRPVPLNADPQRVESKHMAQTLLKWMSVRHPGNWKSGLLFWRDRGNPTPRRGRWLRLHPIERPKQDAESASHYSSHNVYYGK